jgi:hypothetical protein
VFSDCSWPIRLLLKNACVALALCRFESTNQALQPHVVNTCRVLLQRDSFFIAAIDEAPELRRLPAASSSNQQQKRSYAAPRGSIHGAQCPPRMSQGKHRPIYRVHTKLYNLVRCDSSPEDSGGMRLCAAEPRTGGLQTLHRAYPRGRGTKSRGAYGQAHTKLGLTHDAHVLARPTLNPLEQSAPLPNT